VRYGALGGTAAVAGVGVYNEAVDAAPRNVATATQAALGLDDETTAGIRQRASTELPRHYMDIARSALGQSADTSAVAKIHGDVAREYLPAKALHDIYNARAARPWTMGAVDLARAATPMGALVSLGLRSVPKQPWPDMSAMVSRAVERHKPELVENPAAQLDSPLTDMWRRIMFPAAQGGGPALPAVVNRPEVQDAIKQYVAPRVTQGVGDMVHNTLRNTVAPAPATPNASAATNDPWQATRQQFVDAGQAGLRQGWDATRNDPAVREQLRNGALLGGAGLLAGGLGTAYLTGLRGRKKHRDEDDEEDD